MIFDINIIMEYEMFLDTNDINAEAVSSPMLFADERVLQFKEEIKMLSYISITYCCLPFY